MSHRRQKVAVSTASLLYGVISVLAVLLPVTAEEFTFRNVILGGTTVGIAAMMTYYFKELVHREADTKEALGFSDHLREFIRSLPVLIFPIIAVSIGVGGLVADVSADALINGLFYFGLAIVCVAAFLSSYLIRRNLVRALLRTLIWFAICVFMLLIKKAA